MERDRTKRAIHVAIVIFVFLVVGRSRRIMRLVPVFILETYNPTNNECLPKFVQTDNASSSIKTADETYVS